MTCPRCQREMPTGYTSCPYCGTTSRTNDFIKEQLNNSQNFSKQPPEENNQNAEINTQETSQSSPYKTYSVSHSHVEDPGEQKANLAKIFGILSLFLGPIVAIVSLVMVKQYNDIGNGDNYSSVKLAKTLSIISLVIYGVICILSFLAPFIIMIGMYNSTDVWMTDTMNSWMSSSSEYPIY